MKLPLFPQSAIAFVAALLLLSACDAGNEDPDFSGVVHVTGYVTQDDQPVSGALVSIRPTAVVVETDLDGHFATDVEIDSTMNLNVVVAKDDYAEASRSVLAVAGRTIEIGNIALTRLGEAGPASGKASNILLLSQSAQSIGVRESGSTEVAQIVFQATDSLGRPVTLASAVDVHFSFGQNPGGGAFIHPETVRTDNQGRATANVSSGTAAGVVQVVAEAVVEGRTIRSLPVSISVHGGLPDQDHFSIGPEKYNFPGRRSFGLRTAVNVIVGDKYSNPVKTGTSVYFSASHGVIAGSAQTDALGQASVTYISANPLPPDGVTIIEATTADEDQASVTERTPILLSGPARLRVEPAYATLDEAYTVHLFDDLGNPLVEGTKLNVRAEGTRVKAVGHTSVTMGDAVFDSDFRVERGDGITKFNFRTVEDRNLEEDGESALEAITISTSGPNGALEIVLLPEGSASKNADLHYIGNAVEARADD